MQPTKVTLNRCNHQANHGERLMLTPNNRPSYNSGNHDPNPFPSPRWLYAKNQDIHDAHKHIAFHNLETLLAALRPNQESQLFLDHSHFTLWNYSCLNKKRSLESGKGSCKVSQEVDRRYRRICRGRQCSILLDIFSRESHQAPLPTARSFWHSGRREFCKACSGIKSLPSPAPKFGNSDLSDHPGTPSLNGGAA